jgi:hypothetical protein
MNSYHVVILGEGTLSSKEFLRRLGERWPTAHIQTTPLPELRRESVEFEIPMKEQTLYGSFADSGKGVSIHGGGIRDCAEFVHWCRSLIPPSESVHFCDNSMAIDCSLGADMTAVEIERIILSS